VLRKTTCVVLLGFVCVLSVVGQALGAQDNSKELGGLPPGAGQEDVFYQCGSCHSLMLVKQQGLSRARWEKLLVWMVEEQGMSRPSEEKWALILDYLSTHFGSQ
jgi:hypothetical protein